MSQTRNIGKADMQSLLGRLPGIRIGLVTSYDPKAYAVKVKIMPEEKETGWLKIVPLQVGPGAGFGFYCAPDINVQAVIVHQEDAGESGMCIGFLNDDEEDTPPEVPAGEIWAVHKSGSLLKFVKDGDVLLTTQRDLIAQVGRDMTATVEGNLSAEIKGQTDIKSDGRLLVDCADINLGGMGGKFVARHQDPVSGGQVQASSTKVKAV